MASRKPLVVASGQISEMPAGDTIAPSTLPIAATADATGNTRDDVVMTPLKVDQQIAGSQTFSQTDNFLFALAIALS